MREGGVREGKNEGQCQFQDSHFTIGRMIALPSESSSGNQKNLTIMFDFVFFFSAVFFCSLGVTFFLSKLSFTLRILLVTHCVSGL